MFLSEEIVVLYVIGLLFDICVRSTVLYQVDLPDFLKYRSVYYKNTSTISSSCVIGFSVALSYYGYLTIMSYFPVIQDSIFNKLVLVLLMSSLFCTLCRYTHIYPELGKDYHSHINVVTSYLVDVLFAYIIATIFLIYIYMLRTLFQYVKGILFYRQEKLHYN